MNCILILLLACVWKGEEEEEKQKKDICRAIVFSRHALGRLLYGQTKIIPFPLASLSRLLGENEDSYFLLTKPPNPALF